MPTLDPPACYEKMDEVRLAHEDTSFTFTGLDGNYDKVYRMIGFFVFHPTDYRIIGMRPNNISSSVYRNFSHWGGYQGGVLHGYDNSALGANGLQIHGTSNAGTEYVIFDWRLWAETGRWRLSQSESFGVLGVRMARDVASHWQDSTTNITSLVGYITGDHFGAGGILKLFRMRN